MGRRECGGREHKRSCKDETLGAKKGQTKVLFATEQTGHDVRPNTTVTVVKWFREKLRAGVRAAAPSSSADVHSPGALQHWPPAGHQRAHQFPTEL